MAAPKLSKRIKAAAFSPSVSRTFAEGLKEITQGLEPSAEREALIKRLTGPPDQCNAAPFEALWPHAELYLTACVYVAVSDGQYRVEEARLISEHAHRLGFSARQLAELESRVFEELRERGTARMARAQELEEDLTMEADPTMEVDPTMESDLTAPGGPAVLRKSLTPQS